MTIGAKEGMERHLEMRTLPLASQQRAMEEFWKRRQEEIEATVDYNEHVLPMARLKNVIRNEEGGMMMSADMPPFVTKVCELFVQELAVRAWVCAQSHHRYTILDSDIAEAIASTESYDFLVDVLRRHRVQGGSIPPIGLTTGKHRRPNKLSTSRHPPQPLQVPQFAGYPPHVSLPPPALMSVHHIPFPHVRMLQEAPPFVANKAKSTVNGPMVPINYNENNSNMFAGNNSGAARLTPLAGPDGELVNVPGASNYMNKINMMNMTSAAAVHGGSDGGASSSNAAAAAAATQGGTVLRFPFNPPFSFCPFPAAKNGVPTAAGTFDPNRSPPKGVEGNTDVLGVANVQQLQQQDPNKSAYNHHQYVVLQESNDVQDASVGEGELANESLLYKDLEEVLKDDDPLFPDAGLLPPISSTINMEEFNNDQDFLGDVFSNPCSSTSNA